MIGLVARYHRGQLPASGTLTSKIWADDRHYVAKLAALLRLADGLDKARAGRVKDLLVEHGLVP